MENNIYLCALYDCYNKLLTDKQRIYFEDYYFNNLSLSEMSENYNVSRNAVHKQLKDAVIKLEELEEKLKINEKYNKLLQIDGLNDRIKEEIERIIGG